MEINIPTLIEFVKKKKFEDIPEFQKYIQNYWRNLDFVLKAGELLGVKRLKDISNIYPEIKKSENKDINKYYSKIIDCTE